MSGKEKDNCQFHSSESQILGKQFREICDSYGLKDKEARLIDSTLVQFSGEAGKPFEKMKVLAEQIADDQRKEDILAAMIEISHVYIEKHPMSPMGKFARKSHTN